MPLASGESFHRVISTASTHTGMPPAATALVQEGGVKMYQNEGSVIVQDGEVVKRTNPRREDG